MCIFKKKYRCTYIDESEAGSEAFPVRPESIPYGINFLGAFGSTEVEITAWLIVLYFRTLGGWKRASLSSLKQFLNDCDHQIFKLNAHHSNCSAYANELIESRYFKITQGHITVSDEFINRCAGIERSEAFRKAHPGSEKFSILHPAFHELDKNDMVSMGRKYFSETFLEKGLPNISIQNH